VRHIAAIAILAAVLGAGCNGGPTGTEDPTSPTVPVLAALAGVWDIEIHCTYRRDCGYTSDCPAGTDTLSYMVLGGLAFIGPPVDSSDWRRTERTATLTATMELDGEEWLDPGATCSGRGTGCYSQLSTARLLTVQESVALTVRRDSTSAAYVMTVPVRSGSFPVASITFDWTSPEAEPTRFQAHTDWFHIDLRRRSVT
jgi:hypothetical protein